jgi:hypothetical protein
MPGDLAPPPDLAVSPDLAPPLDLAPPPDLVPPCMDSPATLHVNGASGNDSTGDGSCAHPYLSITAALAAAQSNVIVSTLRIGGATPPIVYSTGATGEVFPLSPRQNLALLADGPQLVEISGAGGSCATVGTTSYGCAISLAAPLVALFGMSISSTGGMAVTGTSSGLQLTGLDLHDSVYGLSVTGANATLQTLIIEKMSREGIRSSGSTLSLDTVVVSSAQSAALEASGSNITSSHCTFLASGKSALISGAVTLSSGDTWTSTSDSVVNNLGRGVYLTGTAVATITGATVTGNALEGIMFDGNSVSPAGRLRGVSSIGNAGSGIVINTNTVIDLGSAGSPGGNVFQSTTMPNVRAGICTQTFNPMVQAQGDHFANCPVVTSSDCTMQVDVAGVLSGVDTTGCMAP